MATSLRESFELLGLPTNASEEEVRKAYKQKARECHPDKNPDDPKAKEKFQALSQGYEKIVSGSSATGEFEDDGEPFFGSFFHFVMFHEMMRRRREEEMMARMFGGIFFDEDSDDDDDGIPFGFFGMPSFRPPRHYESSQRSQRWRFEEDSRHSRTSYDRAEGPAKQPKKDKRNRKPANAERNANRGNRPRTTESPNENASKCNKTFDDENSKSKCGQNDFNTDRETHEEDTRPKPNRVPQKSKQRSKNKSQMTSSEWQKGRKHKKRQSAKFSSQPASKSNAEEAVVDCESESSDTGHEQRPPQTPDTTRVQYP